MEINYRPISLKEKDSIVQNEINSSYYAKHDPPSYSSNCSYTCHLCRITVNGNESAFSHAIGKTHTKRKAYFAESKRLKKAFNVTGPAFQMDFSSLSANNALRLAVEDGSFTRTSNDSYFCNVCLLGLNSESQAKAHLEGKNHQKLLKNKDLKPILTEPLFKQSFHPDDTKECLLDGVVPEVRRSLASGVIMKLSNGLPDGVFPEVQIALASGIIEKLSDGEFLCKICNVKMTDKIPTQAHLNGKLHSKKSVASAVPPEREMMMDKIDEAEFSNDIIIIRAEASLRNNPDLMKWL